MRLPKFIVDWRTRRAMAFERTPLTRFKVRLARGVADYQSAFRLVQSAYIALGIEDALASSARITPQHVLPEAYVILVEEGAHLVGTMTVTLDSPAGLPLDKDYGGELADLRRQGELLCELGSLAVVGRCRHAGVTNLLNIAGVTIATQKLRASRLVLGVNPRATEHYRAVFNAVHLGAAKPHAQLVAPVAGMSIDLGTFHDFLAKTYPRPLATGHLLADHFFGAPLPCVELPSGAHEELVRWKLPREVFQELFVHSSDRLQTLDHRTQQYLAQWRTPSTIGRFTLGEQLQGAAAR